MTKFGKKPYVINIGETVKSNESYRQEVWTGEKLQVFVMSIGENDESGVEIHHNIDQFIRIESGQGVVRMGPESDEATFERAITVDDAIFVPAGTYHNIINTGGEPLLLYTIYSGKQYDEGTIHQIKPEMR